jgi:hypothetical protein
MRWPDGVACPSCSSTSVVKRGRDDTQPDRQRYECKDCRKPFDDLTDTVFVGKIQSSGDDAWRGGGAGDAGEGKATGPSGSGTCNAARRWHD